MLLRWFECEKVDLTAEIKISENVLSLFGALYIIVTSRDRISHFLFARYNCSREVLSPFHFAAIP